MRPTSMATSMATSMQPAAPTDFRLSVSGAHVSARRAAVDEGGEDSNCVLADGDTTVQALTDLITGYVIAAPSASQRPALEDVGMRFASAASEMLANSGALASLLDGTQQWAIYGVYANASAPANNQDKFIFRESSSHYVRGLDFQSSNGTRFRRYTAAQNALTTGIWTDGRIDVRCWTYDGTTLSEYLDTVLVDSVASAGTITAVEFALGGNNAGGGAFDGKWYELFLCLAAHDATLQASVTAELKSYWTARGVMFP